MSPAIPLQRPSANELIQLLLIVSLGWLALVAPVIGPGQVFCPPAGTGETALQHLPWMQFLRDSVRGGAFPLWNPHNGLGEPFLANPQTAVLFPLSWLYVALPMTTASFLVVYLKILVAALGLYLFARSLGMGHMPAVIGGVAFGFMPHFILHASQPASNSEIWIPWALAATLMYIRTGHSRWAAALAGILTMSMAGGALQVWGLTALLVVGYFLWFGRWEGPWRARIRYVAGFLTFIPWMLASSGGLWLQFVEYFQSSESSTFDRQFNLFLSPPAHLLHLLIPSFFGDSRNAYGWAWTDARDVVLYAGVVVLLLALTHLFSRNGWREKAFYLTAIILFWMLCLRQPSFLVNGFFRGMKLGWLEFPQLFGFFNLCLLILALRALDGWRWSERRWHLSAGAIAMTLGVFLSGAVFYDFFRELGLRSFELRNCAVFFLFLLAAMGALIFWDNRRRLAFCALLGLVFADLYMVDRAFVEAIPIDRLQSGRENLARLVRSLPEGEGTRFYAPDIPPESNLFYRISSIGTGSFRAVAGFDRIAPLLDHGLRRGFDLREPDAGSLAQIDSGTLKRQRLKKLFDIYGADRLRRALSKPGSGPVTRVDNLRLAGQLGVRYVLVRRVPESGNTKLDRSGADWSVQEVSSASSRVTFHERVGWASTTEQAFSHLGEDPDSCSQEPVLVGLSGKERQAMTSGLAGEFPRPAMTPTREDALTVEVNIQTHSAGWLMVRDLFYPGWQATVDGKPVRVLAANGICRAVAVPAGSHRILFTFQPWTFQAGFLVGVVTMLVLCGWGVIGWYMWSTGAK